MSPKKERIIGPEMLNTRLFASLKMSVLCSVLWCWGRGWGWGQLGLGLGGQRAFTGNELFRILLPLDHDRLPAFIETEEMTSGD